MKVPSAAILVVLLPACYKDDLAVCRRENSELQTRVAKLTEELHQQEYALQIPDMVKGGVITITVFHGSDALQQCETRIAQTVSRMSPKERLPSWCRKLGKE